jgi:hypothetical protein
MDDKTPQKPEASDQDFRLIFSSLLAAYQPILAEDLELAKNPDKVPDPGEGPDCEAEIALANRIFDRFWNEKVALSLLPPEARQQFGSIEKWRWCFLHLRCCTIFGWLLCHGPRGIRGYSYYLKRYWQCVRELIGRPVSNPLTAAEAADYQTLVDALATAYRPYLQDQLNAAGNPSELAGDVVTGRTDCTTESSDTIDIFARMMTPETAVALLGSDVFESRRQDPFLWYCRCWCLCAIRFGCCVARARRSADLYRCVKFYQRCLADCFRPLTCDLTGPTGCAEEIIVPPLSGFLVAVTGTAGGAGFSHYKLEWSSDGITYNSATFYYPPVPPGNTVQGNLPVFGGVLGYLDTTFLSPGLHFVRLTAFSVTGAQCVKTIFFNLLKKDVRILGIDGYFNLNSAPEDPAAEFVENVPALCTRPATVSEVSFGGCVSVSGGAFIGGCDMKDIKSYVIDIKPGYETNCASPGWTNFWPQVDYVTPGQKRFINWRTDSSTLTSVWVDDCYIPSFILPFCFPNRKADPLSLLSPTCKNTAVSPPCGTSGLYTLRLTVTATDGTTYCDTQRVWLDNKDICVRIKIDAVPKCADLFVSQFALPPDCSIPWNLPVSGIVYDPYIDPGMPLVRPNDNFDYYTVTVTKQGGPSLSIPVPGPGGACYYGTSRVGSCTHCLGDPAGGDIYGTLATFDLRAVDVLCSASLPYAVPAGFALQRGDCCVYTFEVYGQDRTITTGGPHHHTDIWPVKICNDLK